MSGQNETVSGRRRGRWRHARWGAGGSLLLALTTVFGFHLSPPAQAASSPPACVVSLNTSSGTEATATIVSGCPPVEGAQYYFSSWEIPGQGLPQRLVTTTTGPNFVVPLSQACQWQVDFSLRSTPPPGAAGLIQRYATAVGGTSCDPGTTTTTTTGSTTTTTAGPGSTTTTTTTIPSPTTATTTGTTTTTTPTGSTTTTTTRPGSTTTTTAAKGGPGTQPGSGGTKTPGSSGGSLAFTGFAVLTLLFLAAVLVSVGIGIARASRLRYDPQ